MLTSRQSTAPNTEHITVMGEAKLEFVPDVVEVSVKISRTQDTAALAKADVDARAARVIQIARSAGCESKEIRASDLTIAPQREYRNNEYHHVGFAAELYVDIKLKNLTLFNRLLAELVDVPVDRIASINTKLDDMPAAHQAALEKAIEDAKRKAEAIARQFDVRLGNVFSINALPSETFYPGAAAASSRRATEDATFEPGTIEVEGRIEVTFYLQKPGAY